MITLSVSNLAWPESDEQAALTALSASGVSRVEVAPTRLGDWSDLDEAALRGFRSRLNDHGLHVSSLQAILYGKPELQLLGSDQEFTRLLAHLDQVADIASELGAQILVFGAPKNRLLGELSLADATPIAVERLNQVAAVLEAADIALAIEPVPAFYGGEFLTNWREVLEMVAEVDHPWVRVHLDTGCVGLAGDNIAEAVVATYLYLAHFHAAQPRLGSFEHPMGNHTAAATALAAVGYDKIVAIEMLAQAAEPLAALRTAISAVKTIYHIGE